MNPIQVQGKTRRNSHFFRMEIGEMETRRHFFEILVDLGGGNEEIVGSCYEIYYHQGSDPRHMWNYSLRGMENRTS